MIYSIGRQDIYDAAFASAASNEAVFKAPRGIVFSTEGEAAARARHETAGDGLARYVLSLDADWMRDTYQIAGEPFRRLVRGAKIMRRRIA